MLPAMAQRSAAGVYFNLNDHLGGVAATFGATGGVTVVRRDAWGKERSKSGTLPVGNYLYTGQRWDELLGLYDYNARYYDPELGRFLSSDSLVPGWANPQAWNRFAYVLNAPQSFTDPSGHAQIPLPIPIPIPIPPIENPFVDSPFGDLASNLGTYAQRGWDWIVSKADDLREAITGTEAESSAPATDAGIDEGGWVHEDDVSAGTEGIYTFPEGDGDYVGQSHDVPGRLAKHRQKDKLAEGKEAQVLPLPGSSKTDREAAEQTAIDSVTGNEGAKSDKVTNKRNPMGPKRKHKQQEWQQSNPVQSQQAQNNPAAPSTSGTSTVAATEVASEPGRNKSEKKQSSSTAPKKATPKGGSHSNAPIPY